MACIYVWAASTDIHGFIKQKQFTLILMFLDCFLIHQIWDENPKWHLDT